MISLKIQIDVNVKKYYIIMLSIVKLTFCIMLELEKAY